MNSFQLNYKVLLQGGIITIGVIVLLIFNGINFLLIDPEYVSPLVYDIINVVGGILFWLLISFFVSRFNFYQVLGVFALLIPVTLADKYIGIGNNPFTMPLIILFWLGVTYLVLPQFFRKYKILIFSVYGLIIFYHFLDVGSKPNYADVDRLHFSRFMIAPIPAFAILWGYEQWRWLRVLQADKAKSELMLLKSQINPHFFFNTLNNLYGLAVEKSDKAPEVILKLSDMMRYTIYEGKEEKVLLSNEIAYLENYIELHQIRYQKKINIQFTKEIQEDYNIAPLLFIILLENAFKHGVERMTAGAYILIRLTAQNKQLIFSIENNFEEDATKRSVGIGLDNLKKRLKHIYPNRHQLEIEKEATVYKVKLTIEL